MMFRDFQYSKRISQRGNAQPAITDMRGDPALSYMEVGKWKALQDGIRDVDRILKAFSKSLQNKT